MNKTQTYKFYIHLEVDDGFRFKYPIKVSAPNFDYANDLVRTTVKGDKGSPLYDNKIASYWLDFDDVSPTGIYESELQVIHNTSIHKNKWGAMHSRAKYYEVEVV